MKFSRLHLRNDKRTMGAIPQVRDPFFSSADSLQSTYLDQYRFLSAPENVLVPKGNLFYKSKLTDVLNASFFGSLEMLASQRFTNIVRQHTYYGVQFFDTTVMLTDSSKVDYKVIHPVQSAYNCLDLELSTFAIVHAVTNKVIKPIKINDHIDIAAYYTDFYDRLTDGRTPDGIMKLLDVAISGDCKLDFFFLRHVAGSGIGWYVSESLKDRIEESQNTGILFTLPNKSFP